MVEILDQDQETKDSSLIRCPECGSDNVGRCFNALPYGGRTVSVWSCSICRQAFVRADAPAASGWALAVGEKAACGRCGTDQGGRFRCSKHSGQVLCRDCCIRSGGHKCLWWSLCNANDLQHWEW